MSSFFHETKSGIYFYERSGIIVSYFELLYNYPKRPQRKTGIYEQSTRPRPDPVLFHSWGTQNVLLIATEIPVEYTSIIANARITPDHTAPYSPGRLGYREGGSIDHIWTNKTL